MPIWKREEKLLTPSLQTKDPIIGRTYSHSQRKPPPPIEANPTVREGAINTEG